MQLCTVRMVDVHIGRKGNHCYEILLWEFWSVILYYKQLRSEYHDIYKGGIREFIAGQLIR